MAFWPCLVSFLGLAKNLSVIVHKNVSVKVSRSVLHWRETQRFFSARLLNYNWTIGRQSNS